MRRRRFLVAILIHAIFVYYYRKYHKSEDILQNIGVQDENSIISSIDETGKEIINEPEHLDDINPSENAQILLTALPAPGKHVKHLPTIHAVLLVRIYEDDESGWTKDDLSQWLDYMEFAGIGHIYLYDNFQSPVESLKDWCKAYYPKLVTYHAWNETTPENLGGSQVTAYRNAVKHYKSNSDWQISIDMNEFPFAPNDRDFNFLRRTLLALYNIYPRAGEFSIHGVGFVGRARYGQNHIMTKYVRRDPYASTDDVKPIYRPRKILFKAVHVDKMKLSNEIYDIPVEVLRLNRYRGMKFPDWSRSWDEVENRTTEDLTAQRVIHKLEEYKNREEDQL